MYKQTKVPQQPSTSENCSPDGCKSLGPCLQLTDDVGTEGEARPPLPQVVCVLQRLPVAKLGNKLLLSEVCHFYVHV